jgi:hypothetical protein
MANIAVKFTPPSACRVQLSFFERLYEHKLDERGLDDSSEAVRAFLGASEGVTQWLLRADSLTPSSTHSPTPDSWSCSGVLKNVNTTNVSSDVDTLHETHCSSATWPLTHSPTTLLLHYSTTPPLSTSSRMTSVLVVVVGESWCATQLYYSTTLLYLIPVLCCRYFSLVHVNCLLMMLLWWWWGAGVHHSG